MQLEETQTQQATHHVTDYVYLKGLPHPSRNHLNVKLVGWIALSPGQSTGPGSTALEIGAGGGSTTEPLLMQGYRFGATGIREASAERLESRFGGMSASR